MTLFLDLTFAKFHWLSHFSPLDTAVNFPLSAKQSDVYNNFVFLLAVIVSYPDLIDFKRKLHNPTWFPE